MTGIAHWIPRRAVVVVALAAAVPRLVALAIERETILEEYVEKSDRFATTLVESGTFGFLPGQPSAYTQPLYAWFLAALYWTIDRHWLVVGLAQVAIAVATALLVYTIGRRVGGVAIGVVAACIATLHPYVIWHDVHVNREILDSLLLAAVTLTALVAHDRRSPALAVLSGALAGVAILGNARLFALPLLVALYAVWHIRPWPRAALVGLTTAAAALLAVTPWVARNDTTIGCAAVTTDARALWKANNEQTYDVLARGGWIDDVVDPPGLPPWPERVADDVLAGRPLVEIDECAQMRFYQDKVVDFWRAHPGEKARLSGQAVLMLWSPVLSVEADDEGQQGVADLAQRTIEPAFMVVLYLLALAGAWFAPRRFAVLVGALLVLNTAMAMLFAGTTRYRAPWDFLLALLAAFAVQRLWQRRARRSDRTRAALQQH